MSLHFPGPLLWRLAGVTPGSGHTLALTYANFLTAVTVRIFLTVLLVLQALQSPPLAKRPHRSLFSVLTYGSVSSFSSLTPSETGIQSGDHSLG